MLGDGVPNLAPGCLGQVPIAIRTAPQAAAAGAAAAAEVFSAAAMLDFSSAAAASLALFACHAMPANAANPVTIAARSVPPR